MGYQLSKGSNYYLSKAAFLESLYFAYQYQEFLDELEVIGDGSKGISYDSQPHGDARAGGLVSYQIIGLCYNLCSVLSYLIRHKKPTS